MNKKKIPQLNYDENSNLVGAQIQQHLLETNRICDSNQNNFHIFNALSSGGPDNLLKVRFHSYIYFLSYQV